MIEKITGENKVKKLDDASIRQKEIPMTLEELIREMKEWSKDADKTFFPSRFRQGDEQITLRASTKNYMRETEIVNISEIYQLMQAMGTLCPIKSQRPQCDPKDEH